MSDTNASNKKAEASDPMRMIAEATPGDPVIMLEAIVEEYARIGWDGQQIRRLFYDPFFQATHGLADAVGHEALSDRIDAVLARCGVMNVTVTHTATETTAADDGTFVSVARLSSREDHR